MDEASITLLLAGDVMTGRGIDQILACPSAPELHESYVTDARAYVVLDFRTDRNGPTVLQRREAGDDRASLVC